MELDQAVETRAMMADVPATLYQKNVALIACAKEVFYLDIQNYRAVAGLEFKNSSARLLAAGLVGPMPKSFAQSPTLDDLELLLNGLKFYEHLQEIA